MIQKTVYGNRKTILIGQDSFYIALPIKVSGSANAVVIAGEPLTGDVATRLTTEFTASTADAVGLLLHEVKLDGAGKGNGTLVVAGCIDKLKLEADVLAKVESVEIPNIIVTEGSAI